MTYSSHGRQMPALCTNRIRRGRFSCRFDVNFRLLPYIEVVNVGRRSERMSIRMREKPDISGNIFFANSNPFCRTMVRKNGL